ncbi:hypothetical protein AtubIFM56815_007432 [Aspergillus tubingensis]|uniref:Zn(2)-C6 fungal-type domain-containing protein n=1 Tax=Aspergillus tubingensis TaxID=5068 RepID=A0A9W6APN9_ASPTU|nr:hypothetical protein AtubIFM56815_007432 [Aspergillus tubingensis]
MSAPMASSSSLPVLDDPIISDRDSPEATASPAAADNTEVTGSSEAPQASDKPSGSSNGKSRQRSRSGCFTCRVRRKKCDEFRPNCAACTKLGLRCEYRTPQWWATVEMRKRQKERIKQRIRQTKIMEKEGGLQEYRDRISALARRPPVNAPPRTPRPAFAELPRAVSQSLPTPVSPGDDQLKSQQDAVLQSMGLGSSPTLPQGTSSVPVNTFTLPILGSSTHTSALPPTPTSALSTSSFPQSPAYPHAWSMMSSPAMPTSASSGLSHLPPSTPLLSSTEWSQPSLSPIQSSSQQSFNPVDGGAPLFGGAQKPPLSETLRSLISVGDRALPLLDHFADNVVHLVFPILEVRPGPALHTKEILDLMQTNKSYLHCCLSASAIHLKNSLRLDDQMDHDIMEHRFTAINYLTEMLDNSTGHSQVMDATLGLIYYHSSVATTEDYLSDIPWSYHFQGVSNLIKKLNCAPSPMNITLIAWVDILGATMIGKTPQFSHTYRQKHTCGISSGLQHMMGCDDRLMYLISEIACLESLWNSGVIDEQSLFQHVSAMNDQINWTEATESPIGALYDVNGAIQSEELAKLVTAIFRIAVRLYLHSLLPNFDSYDATVLSWVAAMGDLLQTIPAGPSGFDRCLAWPLFIAGLYSAPPSLFRKTLAERVAALRFLGDFGSIGRMYQVLKEVWRLSDETGRIPGSGTRPPKKPTNSTLYDTATHPSQLMQRVQEVEEAGDLEEQEADELEQQEVEEPQQESKYIHWREVMRSRKWEYLLL